MMRLFLILTVWWIYAAYSELHSLTFITTGTSGVSYLPKFMEVGLVDNIVIYRYDSNSRRAEPKQDWMTRLDSDDPEYLEENTHRCRTNQQLMKYRMINLKERFNQTGGVHINQWMYGCKWDDKTGEVRGHYRVAYDGNDFISFDLDTQIWIAVTPQAIGLKHMLDNAEGLKKYNHHFMTRYCPEWLEKFLDYGRSSLLRKELPLVSLLQKTPSSAIVCHATGFYPQRAKLFWTRDGKELHEDVAEVLPNPDGTFQMRAQLNLSDPSEDWQRYTCVFQLDGVEKDLVTNLTKEAILTNRKPDQNVTIAASGAALLLIKAAAAVIGVIMCRRAGKSAGTASEEALNPTTEALPESTEVNLL